MQMTHWDRFFLWLGSSGPVLFESIGTKRTGPNESQKRKDKIKWKNT